jgi:Dynein heavy chain, N-terminal region 2
LSHIPGVPAEQFAEIMTKFEGGRRRQETTPAIDRFIQDMREEVLDEFLVVNASMENDIANPVQDEIARNLGDHSMAALQQYARHERLQTDIESRRGRLVSTGFPENGVFEERRTRFSQLSVFGSESLLGKLQGIAAISRSVVEECHLFAPNTESTDAEAVLEFRDRVYNQAVTAGKFVQSTVHPSIESMIMRVSLEEDQVDPATVTSLVELAHHYQHTVLHTLFIESLERMVDEWEAFVAYARDRDLVGMIKNKEALIGEQLFSVKSPLLQVSIVFDETKQQLAFEPPIDDLKADLVEAVHSVAGALAEVPLLDIATMDVGHTIRSPCIDFDTDEGVRDCMQRLLAVIDNQRTLLDEFRQRVSFGEEVLRKSADEVLRPIMTNTALAPSESSSTIASALRSESGSRPASGARPESASRPVSDSRPASGSKLSVDVGSAPPTTPRVGGGVALSTFKAIVEENRTNAAVALGEVEEFAYLGLFLVLCSHRRNIASLTDEVDERALAMFAESAESELDETLQQFEDIMIRLDQQPTTPEELSSLTQYIKGVTGEQYLLQEKIDDILRKYNLLEHFRSPIPDDTFARKWKLFGFPSQVQAKIVSVDKINQIERLKMIRNTRIAQKALEGQIDELVEEISELQQVRDLENGAISTGDRVRQVWERLEAALEDAKKYCRHEEIFEFEVSMTVKKLEDIQAEFKPIRDLWTNACDWTIAHHEWMTGPFSKLNLEQMSMLQRRCMEAADTVIKLERRQYGVHDVAMQLQAVVEDFVLMMPSISRLRHSGMRERHWVTLADQCSFTLPEPRDSFNLQAVIEASLVGWSEEEFQLAIKPAEGAAGGLTVEGGVLLKVVALVTHGAIEEYRYESLLQTMRSNVKELVYEVEDVGVAEGADALEGFVSKRLVDPKKIFQLVEEQTTALDDMSGSEYAVRVQDDADSWRGTVEKVREFTHNWRSSQESYLELLPDMLSTDLKKSLPNEGRKFNAVGSALQKLASDAFEQPSVLKVSANDATARILRECGELLELVKTGVTTAKQRRASKKT